MATPPPGARIPLGARPWAQDLPLRDDAVDAAMAILAVDMGRSVASGRLADTGA